MLNSVEYSYKACDSYSMVRFVSFIFNEIIIYYIDSLLHALAVNSNDVVTIFFMYGFFVYAIL